MKKHSLVALAIAVLSVLVPASAFADDQVLGSSTWNESAPLTIATDQRTAKTFVQRTIADTNAQEFSAASFESHPQKRSGPVMWPAVVGAITERGFARLTMPGSEPLVGWSLPAPPRLNNTSWSELKLGLTGAGSGSKAFPPSDMSWPSSENERSFLGTASVTQPLWANSTTSPLSIISATTQRLREGNAGTVGESGAFIGDVSTRTTLTNAAVPRTWLVLFKRSGALSPDNPWYPVAVCESENVATAINWNDAGTPSYGLLQIKQPSWDEAARAVGRFDLVGVRPSDASIADQLAMADAYAFVVPHGGLSKWGCGYVYAGCFTERGHYACYQATSSPGPEDLPVAFPVEEFVEYLDQHYEARLVRAIASALAATGQLWL